MENISWNILFFLMWNDRKRETKNKLIFIREVKMFYLKYRNEFNYIFGIELEGLSKIYELVEKK